MLILLEIQRSCGVTLGPHFLIKDTEGLPHLELIQLEDGVDYVFTMYSKTL